MVQKNYNKGKGKQKANKPNKTTTFKKKKVELPTLHVVNLDTFLRTTLIERIIVEKRSL